jgi:hypothetical protein
LDPADRVDSNKQFAATGLFLNFYFLLRRRRIRLQFIVILMSADPNPEEGIALYKATHRAIMVAYSG